MASNTDLGKVRGNSMRTLSTSYIYILPSPGEVLRLSTANIQYYLVPNDGIAVGDTVIDKNGTVGHIRSISDVVEIYSDFELPVGGSGGIIAAITDIYWEGPETTDNNFGYAKWLLFDPSNSGKQYTIAVTNDYPYDHAEYVRVNYGVNTATSTSTVHDLDYFDNMVLDDNGQPVLDDDGNVKTFNPYYVCIFDAETGNLVARRTLSDSTTNYWYLLAEKPFESVEQLYGLKVNDSGLLAFDPIELMNYFTQPTHHIDVNMGGHGGGNEREAANNLKVLSLARANSMTNTADLNTYTPVGTYYSGDDVSQLQNIPDGISGAFKLIVMDNAATSTDTTSLTQIILSKDNQLFMRSGSTTDNTWGSWVSFVRDSDSQGSGTSVMYFTNVRVLGSDTYYVIFCDFIDSSGTVDSIKLTANTNTESVGTFDATIKGTNGTIKQLLCSFNSGTTIPVTNLKFTAYANGTETFTQKIDSSEFQPDSWETLKDKPFEYASTEFFNISDDGGLKLNKVGIPYGGTNGGTELEAADNLFFPSLARGHNIPANADLDSYTTAGNYVSNISANNLSINGVPSQFSHAFRLIVMNILAKTSTAGDGAYVRQFAIEYDSGKIATRLYNVNAQIWGSWTYYIRDKDLFANDIPWTTAGPNNIIYYRVYNKVLYLYVSGSTTVSGDVNSWSTIFTLPSGARPSHNTYTFGVLNGITCRWYIASSGAVQVFKPSSATGTGPFTLEMNATLLTI